VLKLFIKPAAKDAGFECVLGLPMGVPGSPIEDIISPLLDADLVLADVTGCADSAVFYLLGVRQARSNGTILIAQDESDILQDFRPYHSIIYTPDIDAQADFQANFQELIARIQAEPERPDNPVQRHLQRRMESQEEIQSLRQQVTDLERAQKERDAAPRQVKRSPIKFKQVS